MSVNTVIEIKNVSGVTLNTDSKYCDKNIQVKPVLQTKTVTQNGNAVPDEGYCGLDAVIVNVPATPTQEKTIDLALASGNQTVMPDSGYDLSKVTVKKPDTLIAENIKKDVVIGGVTGTLDTQKDEQEKSVSITENGSTTVTPDSGKVLSKVTVEVNVSGSQPQLHAPTITKDDTIVTITDSTLNGDFVTGYKLYAGDVLLSDQTENTADLSSLITEYGSYSITAKTKGTNFQDSEASNAIEYVYEQIPSIYEVDGETLKVTNSNYVTEGGILKLL